jgi:hypothetical protein
MIPEKYPNIIIILMSLEPSNIKNKKWKAVFKTSYHKHKTVHFGLKNAQDYTIHKDPNRAELYRARHRNDNLDDPMSPGSLSYYILWSSPDFRQGLINYINHFNIITSQIIEKQFNL